MLSVQHAFNLCLLLTTSMKPTLPFFLFFLQIFRSLHFILRTPFLYSLLIHTSIFHFFTSIVFRMHFVVLCTSAFRFPSLIFFLNAEVHFQILITAAMKAVFVK